MHMFCQAFAESHVLLKLEALKHYLDRENYIVKLYGGNLVEILKFGQHILEIPCPSENSLQSAFGSS